MSMTFCMSALTDAGLEAVLADPPLIWRVISPEDDDAYAQARRASRPSLLARLFGRKPSNLPAPQVADLEVIHEDLDKAWHAIHYLITGSKVEGNPPLNFILAGGEDVGAIDVGPEPARAFRHRQVAEIHHALQALDMSMCRERFRPADMTKLGIYPESLWKDDDAQNLYYVLEHLEKLRRFLRRACEQKMGMIVYYS